MTVNDIPIISFFQRVLDPLIVMGSLYLATLAFGEPFSGYCLVLMILAFFISSAVYQQIDPYRTWRSGRMLAYARDTLFGWCLTLAVLYFLGSASGMKYYFDERVLLAWAVATPLTILASHIAVRFATGGRKHHARELRSIVVVGANEAGIKFAGVCERHPNLFMQVQGFFDDRADGRQPPGLRYPTLGKMAEVAAYVRRKNIKMIFISQPVSAQPRIRHLVDELKDTTASVYFLPDVYVFDLMQARFDTVGGMPVIAISETPFMGFNSVLKRGTDVVVSALALVLLAPLMLLIALAVKLSSPGPVLFKQRRYGLYGEEIYIYKFRSMTVLDDGPTIVQARAGDRRITRIGHFLRRTSLDELPQFINALQGRMSVVGPRPHAVAHNEEYRKLIKGYMLRHKVKPGITGWAQVNGMRGETATLDKMEARIRYDLDYLRNWSLWLDLWIILKTVKVVFTRENAH
ncbi:undecaprenyl-phosphate glucose phosphotransferase [Massilia sp. CFBP9012]|uniref:undecaprenyl-phosphate glucose phosphotransferase n=1 Tax=Massilia sp. CFBP9012 TaxID=3096531 RepID=UPI002A6B0DDF|nr:undecaprenyl-phosphate glucose phosphotransferase [Massilia sp. CFBP9012]MDY0976380.1 undecaprenyl-phosphate glucose phosphotransferase [Massilia sp. CFBP9012]